MKIAPRSPAIDQTGTARMIPSSEPIASSRPVLVEPSATPGFDSMSVTEKEEPVRELPITHRGTVYPWQCDHRGHMNVMWYVGKFDEASWQLISTLGLTRSRFSKEGIGMVTVEQHIDYKRELHAGDLVTIRSAVVEIKEKSMR
jgi:Thioesterase-like superfamily